MIAQFENKLMSSFLLFLDNRILSSGQAYTNHSGLFYTDKKNYYNSYYGYSSPFRQLVSDRSISGANVMSGVYVNDSFTTTGVNINHYNGQVFFNSDQGSATISGNYSVKDFNVQMTSAPEQELLFETKFALKPRVDQTLTGLDPDPQTFPAIFLKNMGGQNDAFSFGGLDNTISKARAIIVSDSAYKLDAATSILRDSRYDCFEIIEPSDLPFNTLGLAATGNGFNYTGMTTGGYTKTYIGNTTVTSNIPRFSDNKLNYNIYAGFVDFELETVRGG
jgi:hypothetical protein